MIRVSHKEFKMSWFDFMQLTGEQVMHLCARATSHRIEGVEVHPQGKGFGSYVNVRTGKRMKAIPIK